MEKWERIQRWPKGNRKRGDLAGERKGKKVRYLSNDLLKSRYCKPQFLVRIVR